MQIYLDYTVPLDQPIAPVTLKGALNTIESAAHVIRVKCTRDGQAVSPSGNTVRAWIQRANNTTVTVTGTVDGDWAVLALPESAYAIPGRLTVTVALQSSNITLATLCLHTSVMDSTAGEIVQG